MLEKIIEKLLAFIGISDKLIAAGGPSFSILLAMAGGVAVAQFFKYPLSRAVVDGKAFGWCVSAVSIFFTFVFALIVTESVRWQLALVVSWFTPAMYHGSLWCIRRWWPWFEMKPFVGAICPPAAARVAQAQRLADKSGENSGEGGTP